MSVLYTHFLEMAFTLTMHNNPWELPVNFLFYYSTAVLTTLESDNEIHFVQQQFDLSPFAYEHLLSRNVNCSHCLFDSQSNTRSRHQAIDMAFVRAFQQSECLSPCSISMDTLTQGRARELTISIQL